jgi:methylated-DNA-[protein]-cysteine S-methyltransferase
MTTYYSTTDSLIGELTLVSDGESITGMYMHVHRHGPESRDGWIRRDDLPVLVKAAQQLREYFAGERTDFDLPLNPAGTAFQKSVWKELCEIPYGATISYGELGKRLGNPAASRAVGLANGRNPISIIIPCHRVIGANGSLTGYGGGLDRKKMLLGLERGALVLPAASAAGG